MRMVRRLRRRMGRSSKRNITEGGNRSRRRRSRNRSCTVWREGSKWRMLDTEGTWLVVAVAVPVVVAVVVVVVAAAAAAAG